MIDTPLIGPLGANLLTEAIGTEAMNNSVIDIGRNKPFTVTLDLKCYMNWSHSGFTSPLTELTSAEYTTIEFTAPDQITRADGSWVDDGYTAGRFITITGAADPANNGTFEIESATATDLTTVEITLETEGVSTTERINGYAILEADDTALLLPAGSHQFRTARGFEAIRLYNPSAATTANVSVFV